MTGPGSSEAARRRGRATIAIAAVALLLAASAVAKNIDPLEDQQQFAWAENGGWVNFEPSGNSGPGAEVHDFELLGWAWAETFGWINLSCKNRRTCGKTGFGVLNDGHGVLSGRAWAENWGWIDFRPAVAGADAGVRIDLSTGVFSGSAWSENGGWIRFDFLDRGLQLYQVATTWNCAPPPPAPAPGPAVMFSLSGGHFLNWGGVPGATGYDVVQGDLAALRASGGDYGQTGAVCLANNETGNSIEVSGSPAPGNAQWFLVRPANCGGAGTFDLASPPQAGSRDAALGGGLVCSNP